MEVTDTFSWTSLLDVQMTLILLGCWQLQWRSDCCVILTFSPPPSLHGVNWWRCTRLHCNASHLHILKLYFTTVKAHKYNMCFLEYVLHSHSRVRLHHLSAAGAWICGYVSVRPFLCPSVFVDLCVYLCMCVCYMYECASFECYCEEWGDIGHTSHPAQPTFMRCKQQFVDFDAFISKNLCNS